MKKKLVSMLLAATMAVTLLAGCGGNSGNGGGTENTSGGSQESGSGGESQDTGSTSGEVVTLTFASLGAEPASQAQVVEAINAKLLEDGLNIAIQIKQLDDYWQELGLAIAGGTEYDIAWAHASTLPELVAKKVYQPIGDALDSVGQELKAKLPEYAIKGGSVNGELYGIPRIVPFTGSNGNTFDVRKDLMTKYGMDEITTLEQLEAYFQAILDNEEGVYPFAGKNMRVLYPVFGNYFCFLGDGIHALYVDPADPDYTVKSFWESEEFVKMCEKKQEWVEKGWQLSDLSLVGEKPDEAFDYGQVGAVPSSPTRFTERIDQLTSNVPGAEGYTVYLEPETRYIFNAGDNMLAVPSTSKHVNEAVQFIQWFKMNQDNYDLWSYGVEGINYELNGDSVDVTNIEADNVYSPMKWMWDDIDLARFSSNYPEESIQRLKDWDNQSESYGLVGFSLDQSNIKSEASQILAIMSEYGDNLGNGDISIHDVQDEIIGKFKAAGLDKVIEEAQKQVDAYVGK